MSQYDQVYEHQWVDAGEKLYLACCDCGLVHEFRFRNVMGHIQFRCRRDNRATGQLRRWHRIRVKASQTWHDFETSSKVNGSSRSR